MQLSFKEQELKCQEEIFFKKIIKIKEQEDIIQVDDNEENFNEEISLQNDEHNDNISLDGVDQAG